LDALPGRTGGQKLAYQQLQEIASSSGGSFEVLSYRDGKNPQNLVVEVSMDMGKPERAKGGLRLRSREKFTLVIPARFPYAVPSVEVNHLRFADFAHVYWGCSLCLYQASETEYDPAQGMFAVIDRLLVWLREASRNNLDPPLQPLHPPTAYPDWNLPYRLVIQADAPTFESDHWLGFAKLSRVTDWRLDIVGWMTFEAVLAADRSGLTLFPVCLCKGKMPHHFPTKATDLIEHLVRLGLPRDRVTAILRCAALFTPEKQDFCLIFGCAMRGPVTARRQHLTAWHFDADSVASFRLSVPEDGDTPEMIELREKLLTSTNKVIDATLIKWCPIMENRKEIVVSRQDKTPGETFRGLRIAVWGCGALGSHVATYLVQSEVASLHLVDSKIVTPGILARQLFDDIDIGKWKSESLALRLRKLRPETAIAFAASDLLVALDDLPACLGDYDLIIDCTASRSVQLKLETVLNTSKEARPAMASMTIDSRAERGLLLFAQRGGSGSLRDASFKAQLNILETPSLRPYADAFFPIAPAELVQPEPGCSAPTFRGSGADCALLSAAMYNGLGRMLRTGPSEPSFVVFTQPGVHATPTPALAHTFAPVTVCSTGSKGSQVRMLDTARQVILDHLRDHKRRRRSHLETGGLLFGQVDEAAGVTWITHATRPPPDSKETRTLFICGKQGTARIAARLKAKYRSSVVFLGMWHTHPDCHAFPSMVDCTGMAKIMVAQEAPRTCLLMILSLMRGKGTLGTYSVSRAELSKGILRMEGSLTDFPLT
jgi:integrative and conjugative element protein (TIGR02256 family)